MTTENKQPTAAELDEQLAQETSTTPQPVDALKELVTERAAAKKNMEYYYVGTDDTFWVKYKGWHALNVSALKTIKNFTEKKELDMFKKTLEGMGRSFIKKGIWFNKAPDSWYLNMYTGRDGWLEPTETEDGLTEWFDILLGCLTDDREDVKNHLMSVIGWKYLHPEEYKLPCILLYGEGRAGKNFLAEAIMRVIFSSDQVSKVGFNQIERFNSDLAGKTHVVFDEYPQREDQSKLKYLVGNKTIKIEQKGMDLYDADNTALYWILCNGENSPIHLEHNGTEERYSFIKVKHQLIDYVARRKGLDSKQAYSIIHNEADKLLNDPAQCAIFLRKCINIASKLEVLPKALHDTDLEDVKSNQKDVADTIFEEIFEADDFTHISLHTLFCVYRDRLSVDNPSASPMSKQTLTGRIKRFLKVKHKTTGHIKPFGDGDKPRTIKLKHAGTFLPTQAWWSSNAFTTTPTRPVDLLDNHSMYVNGSNLIPEDEIENKKLELVSNNILRTK